MPGARWAVGPRPPPKSRGKGPEATRAAGRLPPPPPPPPPPSAPLPNPAAPPLRHEGRWLVDGTGRTVLLHGLNAVWKRAPYVAPDTAAGFTAKDADFLVANGFNAVRLGVLFAGVMPQPGVINTAYLDNVDRIVKLLAARHIYVLLDFHQDDYNEKFTGEGFPAWAIHDDGLPFVPARAASSPTTSRPRSRAPSTTSGPTPTGCGTSTPRAGRPSRSAGPRSPTSWATTCSTSRRPAARR